MFRFWEEERPLRGHRDRTTPIHAYGNSAKSIQAEIASYRGKLVYRYSYPLPTCRSSQAKQIDEIHQPVGLHRG